jgi:hypothetical protein
VPAEGYTYNYNMNANTGIPTIDEELLLDPSIRDWVVIPMIIMA